MRGIVTAFILQALAASVLWLLFWAARIAFWGAQGTVPLLAFVGGWVVIAGCVALLDRATRASRRREAEARLMRLREEPDDWEDQIWAASACHWPAMPKPY